MTILPVEMSRIRRKEIRKEEFLETATMTAQRSTDGIEVKFYGFDNRVEVTYRDDGNREDERVNVHLFKAVKDPETEEYRYNDDGSVATEDRGQFGIDNSYTSSLTIVHNSEQPDRVNITVHGMFPDERREIREEVMVSRDRVEITRYLGTINSRIKGCSGPEIERIEDSNIPQEVVDSLTGIFARYRFNGINPLPPRV